jgi:quinol monooxygenase YgiN
MAEHIEGTSRRDLLKVGAGTAAAAAAIGFVRPALAAEHETVTQIVRFKLDPERADAAEEALKTLTAAVEAKEPDVLAYLAYRNEAEPDEVVFFEVYKDEATLQAHGQEPHLAEMRKVFGAGIFKMPLTIERMTKIGGFMR